MKKMIWTLFFLGILAQNLLADSPCLENEFLVSAGCSNLRLATTFSALGGALSLTGVLGSLLTLSSSPETQKHWALAAMSVGTLSLALNSVSIVMISNQLENKIRWLMPMAITSMVFSVPLILLGMTQWFRLTTQNKVAFSPYFLPSQERSEIGIQFFGKF